MSNETATVAEMPRYRCHKEVWALKIKEVIRRRPDGTGPPPAIVPADEGYGMVWVTDEYIQKHNPQPGGYFVVYEDGYRSFSPAAAFEKGYARI